MKKSGFLSRLTALIIMICIFFGNQAVSYVMAVEEENKKLDSQYVSEVKMFYGSSEDQARGVCEGEGYYFIPTDLKEEAGSSIHAYLGYKTTEDAGNAITDLTLLDMKNSHFEEMTYLEYLDKHVKDFADYASRIMVMVSEFRRQTAAGSPSALAALDSLNLFYVDENKSYTDPSNLLGNYLLQQADVTFFEKYVQRGNAEILSAIINQLGLASADFEPGGYDTWVDRTKTSAIAEMIANAKSSEMNQYNLWYRDSALDLIREIKTFAENYTEASARYAQYGDSFGYETEGITGESTMSEILEKNPQCRIPEFVSAMMTYQLLDGIVFQEANESVVTEAALLYAEDVPAAQAAEEATVTFSERKTLAQYFLELAADENLSMHPEVVYPMISSMSQAQKTALSLCGLNILVRGLYPVDNYAAEREGLIAEAEQNLREHGFTEGKIYLWANVDMSIYNKRTVETSDSIEAKNSGKDLKNSENQAARDAASDLTLALQITDIVLLAASGVTMIVQAIVGVSLWELGLACFYMASLASASALTGLMVGWAIAGTLCCAFYIIGIVVFVASLVYMVYTLLDMFGAFDSVDVTDYSEIPSIVFHARTNMDGIYQVRYDAVESNATQEYLTGLATGEPYLPIGGAFFMLNCRPDVNDMGAYLGLYDRWMTLYYSKAPAAGAPIQVVPGESFIRTQKNDYKAPAGCRPVSLISNSQAANINDIEMIPEGNTGTPLYLFLVTDPNAAPKEEEPEQSADQFITRVQLAHSDSREDAQNVLRKSNFLNIIDVNLTPYDGYTYIGYQLGSEQNALTDIRISTQGSDPILFGDSSYGRAGLPKYGTTPDGMSLYATSSRSAGTPIVKISVETERLPLGSGAEPVCLFSGGNAVDLKHKWSDNVEFFMYKRYDTFSWPWEGKHHLSVRQDDPKDGCYIYFWPKEQYKAPSEDAQAPYVSGFSYFLAGNEASGKFGTNMQFMQSFAKENGFELVMDGDSPALAMSRGAGYMNPFANWQDCEGGALKHDWRYDMYHGMTYGKCNNVTDEGIGAHQDAGDIFDTEDNQTTMYFGVSYTFNPYRALTGVMGLITPYTETTHSLIFSGLNTPAGTLQACNVSIQGNPITHAGICYGYYNYTNMSTALYPNHDCSQRSDLPWLSGGKTEILSRYLLQNGPAAGRDPIARDELLIVTGENPGSYDGYVPVCDLRTPGDYSHPMNFALDTVEKGSQYIYLYLRNDAGGRKGDDTSSAVYGRKHYVAAVYVGSGRTPEEAINKIYSQMQSNWSTLVSQYPDLSAQPLVTELDEILPIDLSDEQPWYTLYKRDTKHCDPSDNEWVRGNDAAHRRWGHDLYNRTNYLACDKDPDDKEGYHDCAYMGVVRTGYASEKATFSITNEDGSVTQREGVVNPVYALMKYYTDDASAPASLSVGDTMLTLAGGPVNSKEGRYYVYYSTNSGTASFAAPVTAIDISETVFINGYNSCYSCSSSDRVNNRLPEYSTLRMRKDEQLYFHTQYDMSDLPYIEFIYLGIGNNQREAYIDLIGSTNACAASSVNCNYNSYSDKWIAIGYRRTANQAHAIRDVFLYAGDNPLDQIQADGYVISSTRRNGKEQQNLTAGKIPYALVKHNIPSGGSEVLSLNEGSGGQGLYLYQSATTKRFAYELSLDAEIFPIRNMAFGYGDISPLHATTEQLADVYGTTMHGMKVFDKSGYADPTWEYILGVKGGSPELFRIDGSAGIPMSLNYGQLPSYGNSVQHAPGDMRVIMYVDRSSYQQGEQLMKYAPRANADLSSAGYYSVSTTYGVLTQR